MNTFKQQCQHVHKLFVYFKHNFICSWVLRVLHKSSNNLEIISAFSAWWSSRPFSCGFMESLFKCGILAASHTDLVALYPPQERSRRQSVGVASAELSNRTTGPVQLSSFGQSSLRALFLWSDGANRRGSVSEWVPLALDAGGSRVIWLTDAYDVQARLIGQFCQKLWNLFRSFAGDNFFPHVSIYCSRRDEGTVH